VGIWHTFAPILAVLERLAAATTCDLQRTALRKRKMAEEDVRQILREV
jgi:hypothetical protein